MDLTALGEGKFDFSSAGSEVEAVKTPPKKAEIEHPKEEVVTPDVVLEKGDPKPIKAAEERTGINSSVLANDNNVSRGRVANFLEEINKLNPNPYIEVAAELLRKDTAKWDRFCTKADVDTISRRIDSRNGVLRLLNSIDYQLLKVFEKNIPTVLEERKVEDKKVRLVEAKAYVKPKIDELRAIGVPVHELNRIEAQMIDAVMKRDVYQAPTLTEVKSESQPVSKHPEWARNTKFRNGNERQGVVEAKYKTIWRGVEFYWQGKGRQPLPFKIALAKGVVMEDMMNHNNNPPYYSPRQQAALMNRDHSKAMKRELKKIGIEGA